MGLLATGASTDLWWRFGKYEIIDNYICPCAGEELQEYSPKEACDKLSKVSETPPYARLVEMGSIVEKAFIDQKWSFNSNNTVLGQEVIEWCSDWGLLGIATHQHDKLELPPGADHPGIRYHNYTRTSTGWKKEYRFTKNSEKEGSIHPSSWNTFFPELEDNSAINQIPRPLSGPFWDSYREPLWHFEYTVMQISSLFHFLTTWNGALSDDASFSKIKKWYKQKYGKAIDHKSKELLYSEMLARMDIANDLISSNRPILGIDSQGNFQLHWSSSSSLIGYFVMMMLRDFTQDGVNVFECERPGCLNIKKSNDPRAKYCSTKCNNRMAQRKLRARKKHNTKAKH